MIGSVPPSSMHSIWSSVKAARNELGDGRGRPSQRRPSCRKGNIVPVTKISVTTVPLSGAQQAVQAGLAVGTNLGLPFTVTVVDSGGYLVAASRMDGAALASVDMSHSKARAALLFAAPTRDLAGAIQPGAPLFGMGAGTRDPLAFVAGGIPLKDSAGLVIGAVGAGGGTPDQDHEVAAAAAEAFSRASA
jgi:uncharacterized protein GlcG (DUF336 family)